MQRFFLTTCLTLLFIACATEDMNRVMSEIAGGSGGGVLTQGEIVAGLKEALRVGSSNVVQQLGVTDGFNSDPLIHIPLPDSFNRARDIARKIGMSRSFDDLELKLNRAAEAATPRAKALLWDSIRQMTLTDAKNILYGPKDAATRYFQRSMAPSLSREMQPIVNNTLAEVGAIKAYNNLTRSMGAFSGLLPDYKRQLTDYVVKLGMDGIFTSLAKEEASIREDPVKRSTAILRRVFGQH